MRHATYNFEEMQRDYNIRGVMSIQEEGMETIDRTYFHPMRREDYESFRDMNGEKIVEYENVGDMGDHSTFTEQTIGPAVDQFENLLNRLTEKHGTEVGISDGDPPTVSALVHCFSGKGRSAALLTALLAKKEAIKQIRQDYEAERTEILTGLDERVRGAAELIYQNRPGTTILTKKKKLEAVDHYIRQL